MLDLSPPPTQPPPSFPLPLPLIPLYSSRQFYFSFHTRYTHDFMDLYKI